MTSTRAGNDPGNQKPNHESVIMAVSVEPGSERAGPDGGLYIYNALAFSTLLSSQETDAHLRRNLRSLPGQPLNLTLEFLSCQLRFRKLSGRLRSRHCTVPLTPRVILRQSGGRSTSQVQRAHARRPEVGPRWLPGSRPAFRRSVSR